MPALRFLGRKWKVGGDEFVLPAILTVLLRLCWVLGLVVTTIICYANIGRDACNSSWVLYTYLFVSIGIFTASTFTHFMIAFYSSKGTIVDAEPRRPLAKWLSVQLVFWALQFVSASFGIFTLLQFGAICYSRTAPWMLFAQLAIALLVFSQLLDLGVTTCCCLVFRGRPEGEEGGEGEGRGRLVSFDAQHGELVALQWQRRCQKMCSFATCVTCKIFGRAGEQNDFSQVARVMATVFNTEGHLDLVASDLLAGLVLLRHVQRRRDQDRRTALGLTPSPGEGATPLPASFYKVADKKILSMNNPSEREVLDEFSYYSKYMLGVYSWPLLVFMDPLCGGCRLCARRLRGCCGGSKVHRHRRMTYENLGLGGGGGGGGAPRWGPPGTGGVRGDESCMNANEGALLALSGLADAGDLAYASFANSVEGPTPYAILVDHRRRAVVLAVRGTLSLEDCLTDALAEPRALDDLGEQHGFDGRGQFAHSGILDRALWVLRDLQSHRILDLLLKHGGRLQPEHMERGGGGGAAAAAARLTEPLVQDCAGYTLRVLGHSLGAGVATLLALLLRRAHPGLRCLAYSPPGGLLTRRLAEALGGGGFLHSLVVGSEIVPRLAFHTLEKIRHDLLGLIDRCTASKTGVISTMFERDCDPDRFLSPEPGREPTAAAASAPAPALESSPFHAQLEAYERQRGRAAALNPLLTQTVLLPPGRIIHLVRTESLQGRGRDGGPAHLLCCPVPGAWARHLGDCRWCGGAVGWTARCLCRRELFTPVWATADELQEIQVSSTMMIDHFPDRATRIIADTVSRLLLDDDDNMNEDQNWGGGTQHSQGGGEGEGIEAV